MYECMSVMLKIMYGDFELELCYACGLKNSECHSCTAGAGSDHDRMGTKHDVHVYY